VIEDEIARRLRSDLKCYFRVEIRCQETTSEDGQSYFVCATVNWKLRELAIELYIHVIKRTCNQGANKSNHPK
jgi:hypothetical protein